LPPPDEIVAAAALALVVEQGEAARAAADASGDPWSPWHWRNGWRLNAETYQDLRFEDGMSERAVRVHYRRDGYEIDLAGRAVAASAERQGEGGLVVELDGVRSRVAALHRGREVTILKDGASWRLLHLDPLAPELEEDASAGRLTAPMPGRILEVLVAPGTRVARGQALVVLEAMKMEHTIAAPADGVVAHVPYAAGDLVEEGAMLLAFEEGNDAAA
jgi:3-methylcrotonyl-CoA carboxylase alpha subunit